MPEETYQKLKSKLKELKPVVEKVKGLLEEYKHSADERLLGEIDEEMKKLGAVEGEIKEIKKFFEERAYKILKAWYPGEDFDEFYQNHVRRNEKMLIEIDELNLARRDLEELELPSIIENIEKLYCNHNKLKTLPENLKDFKRLKELGCHYNQLEKLPPLPEGLKVLYCQRNKLTTLPENLKDLKGLKELYCGVNQLEKLPPLPEGLEVLYCQHNKLTTLPENLKDFKGLKVLVAIIN